MNILIQFRIALRQGDVWRLCSLPGNMSYYKNGLPWLILRLQWRSPMALMNIPCWPIWKCCRTMWSHSHPRSWSVQLSSLSSSEWPVFLRSRTTMNVLQALDHGSWVLNFGRHHKMSTCWTTRMRPTSQWFRLFTRWCTSLTHPRVTQLNMNGLTLRIRGDTVLFKMWMNNMSNMCVSHMTMNNWDCNSKSNCKTETGHWTVTTVRNGIWGEIAMFAGLVEDEPAATSDKGKGEDGNDDDVVKPQAGFCHKSPSLYRNGMFKW